MSRPDHVTSALPWIPWGAVRHDGLPEVGAFLAWNHAVWRMADVIHHAPKEGCAAEDLVGQTAHHVRLDAVTGAPVSRWVDAHEFSSWWRYPSSHYPICVQCEEPAPCRAHLAQTAGDAELRRMRRYENPDTCPACGAPITRRQRRVTYPVNLEVPLGPPVSFHVGRRHCREAAFAYARRCATGSHALADDKATGHADERDIVHGRRPR